MARPRPRKKSLRTRAERARGRAVARGLAALHEPTRAWFEASFSTPTDAQVKGWPSIVDGRSTLVLAPTGSGKTLAAFLAAIDRVVFSPEPEARARCRVLYVSPLKALAVDVERNLRAPLAGIVATAERLGVPFRVPTVGIRSGDTPAAERARLSRKPPDILITTPESLYLLLTSNARESLRAVETVIVDEIHSMVPTKRGSHLFLSLERLEALRPEGAKLQRIGLSATQRPLDEVARLLGGGEVDARGRFRPRPVTIVDASAPKAIEVGIEVPVEDMSRLGERLDDERDAEAHEARAAAPSAAPRSIWPSIHPRLVELVRAHRSTMVFVNSRRLAERLAAALNETAGEEIALAHHGSIARDRRTVIEERLKAGTLPCIVATSSLELGLDLGAVDLVIQIEAPPSVSAGLQRVGRAGHQVGGTSRGIVFPKHRGDLLAAAAAVARMNALDVEPMAYPRNPLDVLAQHVVATVSMDDIHADALYTLVRRAAPFADLARASFDGVLDMLSGRYPSDEFAELRPRITWIRSTGMLRARGGAKRLAVVNAGTIPDRGLYGVFLDTGGGEDSRTSRRVGELDEEMVFEAREGEVFLLGASSWRITGITHERVTVVPAPGQPGKMPFWHGDRVGRSVALGTAIGALTRELATDPEEASEVRLRAELGLDRRAAANLIQYVREQREATGEVPSDRALVVERFIDEMGDWRVCLLSPFGARVHAPLATCIRERAQSELGVEVEAIWSDDGIAMRFPESAEPPDARQILPPADEVEDLLVRTLGGTSLFAARFREAAARALLLPRRYPGRRSPLWAQRKRATDLLAVASRYGSFPILLEAYRECLRDVFDVPALERLLRDVEARRIRVVTADTRSPSPFSSSLLFAWVGSFIYDGDAPLAERRAQALALDHGQLRELLGEAELRELLDADAIADTEAALQRLDGRIPIRHADQVHDLLLSLGDLTRDELHARSGASADGESHAELHARIEAFVAELLSDRRAVELRIAGQARLVAVEDVGRLRDALGIVAPAGVAAAYLESVADPLGDLVSRWARTHGPFRATEVAARFGIGVAAVGHALTRLVALDRVVEGELLPGGHGREHCDVEVLRALKRRSLARLRAAVEPVEPAAYARMLVEWHGVGRPRRGPDALLAAVEQLQGAPIPASVLETEVLPARVHGYRPGDLDALCAAGEVVWRGIEPIAPHGGRIALYLPDSYALLAPAPSEAAGALAARVRGVLSTRGAVFFSDLARETGGFGRDLLQALWDLVWAGEVTNDTLAPLRTLGHAAAPSRRERLRSPAAPLRARRVAPPGSEGRWSLLRAAEPLPTETERRAALAGALLERHGILTREAVHSEGIVGGYGAVYGVLRAMEDTGRVRRGYFVAGLGAAQFALPGADDRLREHRDPPERPVTLVLAATDPASPWGASVRWPEVRATDASAARPQRAAGAQVVLQDGLLVAWLGRGERSVLTFLPDAEPGRGAAVRAIAGALAGMVDDGARRALVVASVDGAPTRASVLARALHEAGFVATTQGYLKRASDVHAFHARPVRSVGRGPDWLRPPSADDDVVEAAPEDLDDLVDT